PRRPLSPDPAPHPAADPLPTRRSSDLHRRLPSVPHQIPVAQLGDRTGMSDPVLVGRQTLRIAVEVDDLLQRLFSAIVPPLGACGDRKSTRLNSSHVKISYAVFCLKKKR